MKNHIINSSRIQEYARQLQAEERASGTVEKYLRDVGAFAAFAEGQPVDKALVAAWKEQLVSQGYAPRFYRLQGEVPEDSEASVPGDRPGAG